MPLPSILGDFPQIGPAEVVVIMPCNPDSQFHIKPFLDQIANNKPNFFVLKKILFSVIVVLNIQNIGLFGVCL